MCLLLRSSLINNVLLLLLLLLLSFCCCCCSCSRLPPPAFVHADSSKLLLPPLSPPSALVSPLVSPSSCSSYSFPLRKKMLRSLYRLFSSSSSSSSKGPIQLSIEKKLQEQLTPEFLEVVNESVAHKGHIGNPNPQLEETHFYVNIRSSKFLGKSLLQQHRLIYSILREELNQGIHALSINSAEHKP